MPEAPEDLSLAASSELPKSAPYPDSLCENFETRSDMSSSSSYQVDCQQQINKSNKKEISKINSEFESQDGELRYFWCGGREAEGLLV
jgi:hypothetical protein